MKIVSNVVEPPVPLRIERDDRVALNRAAMEFCYRARRTSPRIFTGHKVANDDPESRITNFSTITAIVQLKKSGKKCFFVYRYPLSWVHSLTDNIQRWANGRPSMKPFRRSTWEYRFERKSRIQPVITLPVAPGLIVMPYIPNWNLYDILAHGVGNFSRADIYDLLFSVVRKIDTLHAEDKAWGELIVNNVIIDSRTYEPVICDTEVEYFPFVSMTRRQVHDWRDFVFSACGAAARGNSTREQQIDVAHLAQRLTNSIHGARVRNMLIKYCRRRYLCGQRTTLQVVFWQGLGGSLSCAWRDYDRIKEAIATA